MKYNIYEGDIMMPEESDFDLNEPLNLTPVQRNIKS
jgi:hypothetical protein